jgi:hypothetical protein
VRQYPPDFVATIGAATAKALARLPVDKHVKLPADVQTTIARGETEFQRAKRKFNRRKERRRTSNTAPDGSATVPSFITSVADKEVQDRRDAALEALEQHSHGKQRQPPMLVRLRVARIIVDRLQAEGVPFDPSRNSQMNKLVRARLNEMAAGSRDTRKSRRKKIGADAVYRLLKQIKGLGD